jgi:hypothetical protein
LEFPKRSQLFIGAHDETLCVAAMGVSDEERPMLSVRVRELSANKERIQFVRVPAPPREMNGRTTFWCEYIRK